MLQIGSVTCCKMIMTMNETFFELIQVALGVRVCLSHSPTAGEWKLIYDIAKKQSLVGVCFAGVQKLVDSEKEDYCGMNELLYLTWMGMAAKIQQKWEQHEAFIGRLAGFYEKHGIDMMLLKGYGLSLNYPEAKLRNPGDVDVFLSESCSNGSNGSIPAWKKADDVVRKELGVEVRNDSEHHTKFEIDGISVENHYDFVNTRIRRSSQKLEKVFKELAQDKTNVIDVRGQKVILPSDKLNAIFLLRHCAGHFASEGITMRNVLDWGLFVQSANDLDWEWLWQLAKEYNMHRFLACLNMICIEDLGLEGLGFKVYGLWTYNAEFKRLKARVLEEIMNGTDLVPNASAWERTKRWWLHRWKHEICYSDSMLSSFVYSVRANLGGTSVE